MMATVVLTVRRAAKAAKLGLPIGGDNCVSGPESFAIAAKLLLLFSWLPVTAGI